MDRSSSTSPVEPSVTRTASHNGPDSRSDRGPQQERPDLLWLTIEHLGHQVVGDMAVVAVERGDERVRVLPVANRQAGQDQPGRPALGPFHEALHVAGGKPQAHGAFKAPDASSCVNRSSATRSSTSSPLARILARASGGSARAASATWTPAGRWSRKKPSVWWQAGLVTRW